MKESFDALDGEQATLGEVEEQNNQHNIGGKRTHFLDNNQEIGLHVPKLHWERKIFIYDKKKKPHTSHVASTSHNLKVKHSGRHGAP